VLLELTLAAVTFVALRRIDAPYGRHSRTGWGPTGPARVGWLVMESPAALLFAAGYAIGVHRGEPGPTGAARPLGDLGYPLLLRPGARMPVTLMLLAIGFNVLNGWINARWLSALGSYPAGWLADPRFLAGVALFAGGLALNATFDRALRRLRGPGVTGY